MGDWLAMKIGVVTFSYATFDHFDEMLARDGVYAVNLGDNAQTIAARRLLQRLGVASSDIVDIDRDTLPAYGGTPVTLLMNAVFRPQCFPIPEQITPIFLGFCARPETLAANSFYLKRHQPIGCRDTATAEALRALGIDAFVSGCVTLTLPRRGETAAPSKTYVIHGWGSGAFPGEVLSRMPEPLLRGAEFVFHRLPVFEFPLSPASQRAAERYEAHLLDELCAGARLVVTPLHHAAAPCLAMGVPTIICRNDDDPRFSFLKQLTPVYGPEAFGAINWFPPPLDVSAVARAYEQRLAQALAQPAGKP